jgi:hypothetical protein
MLLFLSFIINVNISFASQNGKTEILFISNEPGCNLEYNGNFTAGDKIYVKIRFNNTGTENLINAKTFIIDSFNGNYGRYSTSAQLFNLNVGESMTLCYSYDTYSSYEDGKWTGRVYFRNNNNRDMDSTKLFYFNISNNPNYQNIAITTNLTSSLHIAPYEQKTFYIDVRNTNPTTNYSGNLRVTWSKFTDTLTTSRNINILPLETQRFTIISDQITEPRQEHFGLYSDASTNQDNIRKWYLFYIDGDFYKYSVFQLFSNQSVFLPGEKGKIDAYVLNMGNTEWNSTSTYRFLMQSRRSSSDPWENVYDETFSFSDLTPHQPSTYQWYESNEFTNNFDYTLTNFRIFMYNKDPNGIDMNKYFSYSTYYSEDAFPDITSSCFVYENEGILGLEEVTSCNSGSDSIVFIQKPSEGDLLSIIASSGNINSWWEGQRSGLEGYFINGDLNSDYEITHSVFKVTDLDGFDFNFITIFISIISFLLLYNQFKFRK